MNKSLKAAIISGLVAGFVLGIAVEFFDQIAASIGLFEPWWRPINTGNMIINIPIFSIWGIILGIIFSKAYSIIPKEGVLKGLVYGLFLWLIISVRAVCFNLAYGYSLLATGHIFVGFFYYLLFGLVLGILYDELVKSGQYLNKEKKIETYDVRSGILPGAIAGLLGGFAAGITAVLGTATGAYYIVNAPERLTFDFFLSQGGAHAFVNMIWSIFFGMIFARVYNLVPSRNVKKGILFSLILYFIYDFHLGTFCIIWAFYHNALLIVKFLAYGMFVIGIAQAIVFGLVLGLLYRKPPK